MATHSSALAWRIPWMEESAGLQSTGSQRVRHDWAAKQSTVAGWEHCGPGHRTSGLQQIGVTVLSDPCVPGLFWAHFVRSILGHSAPWVPGTLIATCFSYRFLRPVLSLTRMHFLATLHLGYSAFGPQRTWSEHMGPALLWHSTSL